MGVRALGLERAAPFVSVGDVDVRRTRGLNTRVLLAVRRARGGEVQMLHEVLYLPRFQVLPVRVNLVVLVVVVPMMVVMVAVVEKEPGTS